MSKAITTPHRIVIAGGGFGGAYTALGLRRLVAHESSAVSLTLISKNNYFLFTPLLHEVATGGVGRRAVVQSLYQLLPHLSQLVEGEVQSIDHTRQVVQTSAGEIPYDTLVLALGSTTDFMNVPGALEHSLPLKTPQDATRLRSRLLDCLEAASQEREADVRRQLLTWVVVGGGPTGVELAAEMVEFAESFSRAVPQLSIADLRVVLCQAAPTLLPMMDQRLQQASLARLQELKVEVRLAEPITAVYMTQVKTVKGETIPAGLVVWTAGVRATDFAMIPEIPCDKRGRFTTQEDLSLPEASNIFVVGDLVAHGEATAQAAEAMATVVAQNIAADRTGGERQAFAYRKRGDLLSLGQWRAAGIIYGIYIYGRFTWWLWRTVYLFKIIGWPNRLRVALDWTIDIFYSRDLSRIDTL